MKMKAVSALLFTTSMLLTACSNKSIAGRYGFQMGKEKGTHFGLFLDLTDNYVTIESQPEVTNKYKECNFTLAVSQGDDDSESVSNLITLLGVFLHQEGEIITVPGYYYKGEKIGNTKEIELKIGIDFAFFKDLMEEASDDSDDMTFPVLEPEMIEKIVYTTYGNNTVTMYIPVAEQDAIFQLYWYGIDVIYDSEGLHLNTDIEAHHPGTHPTAEEVAAINETYGEKHQQLGNLINIDLSSYRDYYTLAMGLIKH